MRQQVGSYIGQRAGTPETEEKNAILIQLSEEGNPWREYAKTVGRHIKHIRKIPDFAPASVEMLFLVLLRNINVIFAVSRSEYQVLKYENYEKENASRYVVQKNALTHCRDNIHLRMCNIFLSREDIFLFRRNYSEQKKSMNIYAQFIRIKDLRKLLILISKTDLVAGIVGLNALRYLKSQNFMIFGINFRKEECFYYSRSTKTLIRL